MKRADARSKTSQEYLVIAGIYADKAQAALARAGAPSSEAHLQAEIGNAASAIHAATAALVCARVEIQRGNRL